MFATEGVPRGRPASPRALSRRLPVGRIHSGRPPSVYHQTPPEDVCNGGGSTGEACLPPCTFTQVARRPDSFRPSPKRVPPDASRRCLQRRGFHGGGLPPPCTFTRRLPVGRIHSGRPPSVYHQTAPEDVRNGGGSTGEACLPPCTFTQVARRPDSFRPSPKRVPPDAS